ncbi:hypothetical protein ACLMJK_005026 [Lecanora helva]
MAVALSKHPFTGFDQTMNDNSTLAVLTPSAAADVIVIVGIEGSVAAAKGQAVKLAPHLRAPQSKEIDHAVKLPPHLRGLKSKETVALVKPGKPTESVGSVESSKSSQSVELSKIAKSIFTAGSMDYVEVIETGDPSSSVNFTKLNKSVPVVSTVGEAGPVKPAARPSIIGECKVRPHKISRKENCEERSSSPSAPSQHKDAPAPQPSLPDTTSVDSKPYFLPATTFNPKATSGVDMPPLRSFPGNRAERIALQPLPFPYYPPFYYANSAKMTEAMANTQSGSSTPKASRELDNQVPMAEDTQNGPFLAEAHGDQSPDRGPSSGSSRDTESSDDIRAIILRHIQAIEDTGHLGEEGLTLLHSLRAQVIPQGSAVASTAEESTATTSTSDTELPDLIDDHQVTDTSNNAKEPEPEPNPEPANIGNDDIKAVQATMNAGGATTSDAKPPNSDEDREHQVYFHAWGKQQQRDAPASRVRTVTITDIPSNATLSFVAGLVYGGAIEFLNLNTTTSASGDMTATVRFMKADDCMSYYNATCNGVVYGKDAQGRELACFVKLGKDVDVVGGLLSNWIEHNVTRCVRAVGVDTGMDRAFLIKVREGKMGKLEGVSDTINPNMHRAVVWRFCKVEDAVHFKASLSRDEEWEHCNIHHAVDPCATATGVHIDD